ncbi:MAG: glucuronate isomerase, partial [Bacteroidota bacterium]|nr:glucuronate isomerase [Bacteroidota bacterium]
MNQLSAGASPKVTGNSIKFLDENFLLQSKTARQLYHDFAREMPIIDYHNHLPPEQIARDHQFQNITQVWLYGDHYKWRAMRTNGVPEAYSTGDKSDWEKFEKWAATVPYTLRNPLYHWTHLELQRYFNVHETLSSKNAREVYETCTALLQTPEYSVRNLLRKMNVETVCTTDDPIDSLEHHQKIKQDGFEIKVLPAFRPDKAMQAEDLTALHAYIQKLEAVTNTSISTYNDYLTALKSRHDYFAQNGCAVSDHGLEQVYAEEYT